MPAKSESEQATAPAGTLRTWLLGALGVTLAIVAAGALAIYLGAYDFAADVPHTQPVYWLLETARDRSIEVRATGVVAPDDLSDPKRVQRGAGHYAAMCSPCHLAPGMKRSEIARGLYPRAPELRHGTDLSPSEEFWAVKHGLKMTGMPAWGVTHSDEQLWDVVAFLQKLPELTPEQYQSLVKSAPSHPDLMKDRESGQTDGEQH
jgi:mono/diheme cytochrome c family protein